MTKLSTLLFLLFTIASFLPFATTTRVFYTKLLRLLIKTEELRIAIVNPCIKIPVMDYFVKTEISMEEV